MKNNLSKITLLFSIFSFFQSNAAFGQLHFYPKFGLNTSFTTISENDYVSKAFTSKPAPFFTFGVGFSKHLSDRIAFQSEIMLQPLGFNATVTTNYTGNKKWMSNFKQTGYIRCQQVNLSWQFESKPGCTGWIKYFKLGGSTYFKVKKHSYEGGGSIVNIDPVTNQKDSVLFFTEESAGPFVKFGLLAGVGLKRTIKEHNYLSFGLTYHHGFSKLSTTTIGYQVDGQNFTNHLLNKGTALVLEVTYGIALRKKYETLPDDF